MHRTILSLSALLGVSALHGSPWDPKFTAMAEATLAKMSSAEKFTLVHGAGGSYVGNTPAITLSDGTVIPQLNLEDGPQGVADGVGSVTAWPSALTVVQSWDTSAMEVYGSAMGREQWLKGTNVMLGPGVNLGRVPWGGRNFEYRALARCCAPCSFSGSPLHPSTRCAQRARTPCWPLPWWLQRSRVFRARTFLAA
jgi:hypothetical protein